MLFTCRWIQETLQIITTQKLSEETSGRRELGSFGKGRTETDRIARRASKVEGKINNDKGVDLKDMSVTKRIMSAHRKDKIGILSV